MPLPASSLDDLEAEIVTLAQRINAFEYELLTLVREFDLPIETVRRLYCDSAVVVVEEDGKRNPLHVGRKHRVVQPALRRALLARDRCDLVRCEYRHPFL